MRKYYGMVLLLSIMFAYSVYGEISENYTLTSSNYTIKDINGTQLIIMDGFYTQGSPGNPMLPSKAYTIILPSNCNLSTVKLEIIEIDGDYLNGSFNIPPAPPMVTYWKNKTIVDYGVGKNIVNGYNINVYNNNSLYPEKPVTIVSKGELREAKLVTVKFTPMQYNPVEKKVYHNKKVVFKISYELNKVNAQPLSLDTTKKEYVMSPYTSNLLKNYDLLNPSVISNNICEQYLLDLFFPGANREAVAYS
jgi:hypothetical protein